MNTTQHTCKTCKYYFATKSMHGEAILKCRRYPPKGAGLYVVPEFPNTYDSYWCGEYSKKEETND